MMLEDNDQNFIKKRTRLIKLWPITGGLCISILLGLIAWLFFKNPLLANPFYVIDRLKENSIDISMLTLMAGILPIVVLSALLLCVVLVLLGFIMFSHEKKYLRLISELSSDKE